LVTGEELDEVQVALAKLISVLGKYEDAKDGKTRIYNPVKGVWEEIPVNPELIEKLKASIDEEVKRLKELIAKL